MPIHEEQRKAIESIIQIADEIGRRQKRRKIYKLYPEKGPLRRNLYKPHMYFFKAGATYLERCILAANRIGKSYGIGGYETTLHLTGLYPDWWEGKRFSHPIRAWVAGDSLQTVRDISQEILLGPPGSWGTGLIPGDMIKEIRRRSGSVANAVDQVLIEHVNGGLSTLGFKTYEQSRSSFQGTSQHVIWADEECPMDIYSECLIRTMTVEGDNMGIILLTFTPLMGLTEVVLKFMPNGTMPEGRVDFIDDPEMVYGVSKSTFAINATWDHAPHLTEEQKQKIIEGTPLYLRDARSKGIPQLGAGAVYPILQEDIVIDDFQIPPWYLRAYALDTGWNNTAALWGAWDRENDVIYLNSCYKQGHAEPETHVRAIKSRGDWIPGVGDYAGASQLDGKRVIDEYINLGLNLYYPDKHIESGIFAVWERLVTGRLKIFKSLVPLLNEMRIYRRNDKGQVADGQDDHLCDCMRYLVVSGGQIASLPPIDIEEDYIEQRAISNAGNSAGYFGLY